MSYVCACVSPCMCTGCMHICLYTSVRVYIYLSMIRNELISGYKNSLLTLIPSFHSINNLHRVDHLEAT